MEFGAAIQAIAVIVGEANPSQVQATEVQWWLQKEFWSGAWATLLGVVVGAGLQNWILSKQLVGQRKLVLDTLRTHCANGSLIFAETEEAIEVWMTGVARLRSVLDQASAYRTSGGTATVQVLGYDLDTQDGATWQTLRTDAGLHKWHFPDAISWKDQVLPVLKPNERDLLSSVIGLDARIQATRLASELVIGSVNAMTTRLALLGRHGSIHDLLLDSSCDDVREHVIADLDDLDNRLGQFAFQMSQIKNTISLLLGQLSFSLMRSWMLRTWPVRSFLELLQDADIQQKRDEHLARIVTQAQTSLPN